MRRSGTYRIWTVIISNFLVCMEFSSINFMLMVAKIATIYIHTGVESLPLNRYPNQNALWSVVAQTHCTLTVWN